MAGIASKPEHADYAERRSSPVRDHNPKRLTSLCAPSRGKVMALFAARLSFQGLAAVADLMVRSVDGKTRKYLPRSGTRRFPG
jgi:hypothetical protein